MAANAEAVEIPADSETGRLLRAVGETPTVFVVDGFRYRVLRELTPTEEDVPSPALERQRTSDGMMAAAGAISGEEADRWIEDIYRWRREGSRPTEPSE